MELLENLYENPPLFSTFFGRKYKITSKKTLIKGVKKSGTTSIIADFLSSLKPKSYLYIDLDDARVDAINLKKLNEFIEKFRINSLVVENYRLDFLLPNIENIILSTNNFSLDIENFTPLYIKGLNFEEFIGFSQRYFNVEHIFNLYSNTGNLPKSTTLNKYENGLYMQECIKLSLPDTLTQKLFHLLVKQQATPYSFFKAYNELKREIKISKDKLYKEALNFETKGLIRYIEKFNSPKSAKKIYLSNFAYKNSITYEKDFIKKFENMVFCELEQKDIFYTNELHFFIPKENLAILCIPFLPPELILRRFEKLLPTLKKLQIKTLQIITIGNEGGESKKGITCEIIPFWEWALML